MSAANVTTSPDVAADLRDIRAALRAVMALNEHADGDSYRLASWFASERGLAAIERLQTSLGIASGSGAGFGPGEIRSGAIGAMRTPA